MLFTLAKSALELKLGARRISKIRRGWIESTGCASLILSSQDSFEYWFNSRVASISVKIIYDPGANTFLLVPAGSTFAYPRVVSRFAVFTMVFRMLTWIWSLDIMDRIEFTTSPPPTTHS